MNNLNQAIADYQAMPLSSDYSAKRLLTPLENLDGVFYYNQAISKWSNAVEKIINKNTKLYE